MNKQPYCNLKFDMKFLNFLCFGDYNSHVKYQAPDKYNKYKTSNWAPDKYNKYNISN